MVESHQWHYTKLFTNGFSFSKVLKVGIHLINIDGTLGTKSKVLDSIYLIVDLLLILGVEVGIGAKSGVLLHNIGVDIAYLKELPQGEFLHGLGRPCGGLLCCHC
jgi:hypothetical protein